MEANQSTHDDKIWSIGTIVRTKLNGIRRISIITEALKNKDGDARYKVRHLNEKTEHAVPPSEIEAIQPEPADIQSNIEE